MKRDYFSRMSLWAKWYLPTKEAAEVLEDYSELIAQEPGEEEDLRRKIGTPREAVCRLIQPKDYRRWLTVFGILAVCVMIPALLANQRFWVRLLHVVRCFALILSIVLSSLWFRREGRREERFPKPVLFWMALVLVGILWAAFLAWIIVNDSRMMIEIFFPPENTPEMNVGRGQLIQISLIWSSVAMIAASLFGLLKARIGDCRWRALYVFSMTGSLLTQFVYGILTSMSFYTGWQTDLALRLIVLIVIGLAGTGAALC